MTELIAELCARFGLGEVISSRRAGGTRNLSFVVKTDRGRWVARRRYEGYCDPERVAFDHAAARLLADNGVPVVAPCVAVDGESYWRRDSELWEAYPFAAGRHVREGNRDDVLALARSLADFHRAGRSFDRRHDKLGPRGETDPAHLLASIQRLRAEGLAPDAVTPYERAATTAASRLTGDSYAALPHTLVHGDVQPANVLMRRGRVSAFLDLDWCAWRPRVYDLSFAMLCCCARHARPIGAGEVWLLTQAPQFDAEVLDEFLATYEAHSWPLTEGERAALPAQTTLTWCHARVDNALKVPPAERPRFLRRDEDRMALTRAPGGSELARSIIQAVQSVMP